MKFVVFLYLAIVTALVGAFGAPSCPVSGGLETDSSVAIVAESVEAMADIESVGLSWMPAGADDLANHEVRVSAAGPKGDAPSVGRSAPDLGGHGHDEGDGNGDNDRNDSNGDNDDDVRSPMSGTSPYSVGHGAGLLSEIWGDSSIAPHRGHGRSTDRPPRA